MLQLGPLQVPDAMGSVDRKHFGRFQNPIHLGSRFLSIAKLLSNIEGARFTSKLLPPTPFFSFIDFVIDRLRLKHARSTSSSFLLSCTLISAA